MSAYDNDPRVHPHPDGSWTVFADDCSAEYAVLQNRSGQWDSYASYGRPLPFASDKATKDAAIRALIGDPR